MHKEMFSLLDSQNDFEEASKYCDLIGQDVFWENICDLLNAGISDEIVFRLLKIPSNIQNITKVAVELERMDKLNILSNLVLAEEAVSNDPLFLPLKLKILVDKDEKTFLDLISKADVNTIGDVLKYCEYKNPNLVIKYHLLNNNAAEILRLTIKYENWDTLSLFLINYKNVQVWISAFDSESGKNIFDSALQNSDKFQDTESASCLIKALVTKNDSDSLLKIMKSWIENNKVLCSSRALQTLYMIQLIKVGSNQFKLSKLNISIIL